MIINFKHVDMTFPHIDDWIMPIVNLANENEIFFQIVCDILSTYKNYKENLYAEIDEALKLSRYKVESEDSNLLKKYNELSTVLLDFYFNVISDDLGKELFRFNQDLYYKEEFRYAGKRVSRYRGLLFEELVISLVEKRFENELFDTGCQVYINKRRVIARYGKGNASHKETIDIAGWCDNIGYGEFYECKISPNGFKIENYKYLMELDITLKLENQNQYIIGFVSSDSDEMIRFRKEFIESKDSSCKSEFSVFGRDSIYALKSISIPEIA